MRDLQPPLPQQANSLTRRQGPARAFLRHQGVFLRRAGGMSGGLTPHGHCVDTDCSNTTLHFALFKISSLVVWRLMARDRALRASKTSVWGQVISWLMLLNWRPL